MVSNGVSANALSKKDAAPSGVVTDTTPRPLWDSDLWGVNEPPPSSSRVEKGTGTGGTSSFARGAANISSAGGISSSTQGRLALSSNGGEGPGPGPVPRVIPPASITAEDTTTFPEPTA